VKLSAFTVVDEYDELASSRRLSEVVALAEAAEAGDLSALWVAEHHFHPGGVCPSPPVLLAACGARTRRLRLGSLVSVLPFHRPIEVAEQYAMLDRLLDGRLNFGVGSGYLAAEFEGFGIDPATKRDRFDRALDTVLSAWSGEEVRSVDPPGVTVRINVLPVQRPHPPVWVAVQRREAIPYVAQRGHSIALIPYATVSGLPELSAEIREYRAGLPAGVRGRVSVGAHVYAGPHPDRARVALQRYLDSRLATQSTFYSEKVRKDPNQASARTIEENGWAVFGTPSDVASRLESFASAGVDELLGIFDFGGLPAAEVGASVTELGRAISRAR
jgi:alkanesulfonate monooxygenase SsuD/methylene tetrahydromethanopterin reductase-like flavin-dependent oxidoreductase (luciferase family)